MATIVAESTLRSRRIRIAQTKDPQGIRRIDPTGEGGNQLGGGGGIFSWVVKKLKGFFGFVFGIITKFFPLSISSIFGMLVQAYFALKTFDWNTTDKAIEAKIKANNNAIKMGLAPVIGQTLGWGTVRLANFAIGRLAGRASKSNQQVTRGIHIPVLSAKVGLALAEESNQEIRGALLTWLSTVRNSLTSNLIMNFLLTARNMRWFGMEPITTERPNGSFAAKIDKQIKKLPDDWEDFAEEVLEEFEEAIIEAGYVVAFEIDDHFIAQRMAQKQGASTSVDIVIEPKS